MEFKQKTVTLIAFMILTLAIIGNYNMLILKTSQNPIPAQEASEMYKLESEAYKKDTELKITELTLCIAALKAETGKMEAIIASKHMNSDTPVNEQPEEEWEFIKRNFKRDIKVLWQDYKNMFHEAFSAIK